jgi:hypothetical protein
MSPSGERVVRCAFNALPAEVRRRIAAVAQREGKDPVVLAREFEPRGGWFTYVLLVGALGATAVILSELLRRSACREPQYQRETYAMLAGAVAIAWMAGVTIARRFLLGVAPYAEGRYVFPTGLLKLDGGDVEFIPLAAAGAPKVVTHLRNHQHSHTTVEFAFPWSFRFDHGQEGRSAAQAIVDVLNSGAVPEHDPLLPCVRSGSWTAPPEERAQAPLYPETPRWFRLLRFPGGLALAAALAAALYTYCATR